MQDLPSLGKAYFMVITEEKQKINIRSKTMILDSANASKVVEKTESTPKTYTKSGRKLNTDLFCDHCNSYGHIRSNCWHLVGYPKKRGEKENEDSNKKKAKTEVAANTLSEDNCKLLKSSSYGNSSFLSNFFINVI